ncbi:MAG: Holliday junction resolvase RuvX [Alphaproteobacteria bacterium]|nr:Holliday junction resolvase RuvX [Alphaproteobacteria bacterium]
MILDTQSFKELKSQKKRLLALDVGEKTIGVAMCDASWTIATPYTTLQRKNLKIDCNFLMAILQEHDVVGFVMGYPLHMNGSEGESCARVQRLIQGLSPEVPVFLWDERLSTTAVERTLLSADTSRKKRKTVIDKMAASYILQGVLDRFQ